MAMRRATGTVVAVALLAVPALAHAACTPEVGEDAVTVESCPIEHTGYRLVRSRTTAAGTVGGVVPLLQEDAGRDTAAGPPHRSILHEVTGASLSHRVVVSRRSWWRLDNGGVVLDIVGADDLATDLEGTRVLCLRSRWTITPGGTLRESPSGQLDGPRRSFSRRRSPVPSAGASRRPYRCRGLRPESRPPGAWDSRAARASRRCRR